MRIGIVGGGFVGGATALLKCPEIEVVIYDLDPSRCSPPGTTVKDLMGADFVFVCVPTPTYVDGSCNTTIVKKCIEGLQAAGVSNIVLRSTVPPGTSDMLNVDFMPEFLTEANWRSDFYNCLTWVFSTHHAAHREKFKMLMATAAAAGVIKHNNVVFTDPSEGEMIKYVRNNYLATKISFFNEMFNICAAADIDYDVVRKLVSADSRIGASHTAVPGPDGHFGYGGTCLPKDTSALRHFAKSKGVEVPVLNAVIERNKCIDRPERDWEADPRAFTAAPR